MLFVRKFLLLPLLVMLLLIGTVNAAVFTVTTNADSGPGSLRAAILAANANGVAVKDDIQFNIVATTSNDVTITLLSELPALTSNMVVDATTQPIAILGSTVIKIQLIMASSDFINGFILDGVNLIEIYGFNFFNFTAAPNAPIADLKGAIFLKNATDIIIGAPNRYNAFSGNYAGVLAPSETHVLERIKIQSNYFGLYLNGTGLVNNINGMDISYLRNSIIGGTIPAEGNIFGVNSNSAMSCGAMSGNVTIGYNVVGQDATGKFAPSSNAIGIYANGEQCNLLIADNIVVGQKKGLFINQVGNGFTFKRNRIGTGKLGTESYPNTEIGIEIYNCPKGSIGSTSSADANLIAYNRDGILINRSYPITITKNSMYCNTRNAVDYKDLDPSLQAKIVIPKIASITTTSASGNYLPNAVIELFYDDECGACQGKTWLASVQTQSNGNWQYNGQINGSITSTGTNSDGATSTFSSPVLNDVAKSITNEYCGKSNGSITNIEVSDASEFRWYNSNNVLVSNTKALSNAPAGMYYLVAGQPGACNLTSPFYEIKAINLTYAVKTSTIKDASCGKANGSVLISSFENTAPNIFKWLDENDQIVSTNKDLTQVLPGTYRLIGSNGLGCENTVQTFVVGETTDMVINTTKMSIVNTECLKNEGSILNLTLSGGTAPYQYEWFDENGVVVGAQLTLIEIASGNYYLKITDASGCFVQSAVFTIPPSPSNIKLASSFTPNGDGVNDVWKIPGLSSFFGTEVKIFNRYGRAVFYTKNNAKDFDGRQNNKDLPIGVYYYVINLNNNCKELTGSLTLIR